MNYVFLFVSFSFYGMYTYGMYTYGMYVCRYQINPKA